MKSLVVEAILIEAWTVSTESVLVAVVDGGWMVVVERQVVPISARPILEKENDLT
jgi:hypothetical protein